MGSSTRPQIANSSSLPSGGALVVHNSNRLENLAAAMAAVLREPVGSVLAPETIIVQSNGMARWLSFELARSEGISANLEFPYPASFIWKLYQQVLGDELPKESPYNANRLQWTILDCLPACKGEAAFAPISHYLEQTDPRNHLQLASKIADVFDQYLVYRPDWIASWESGEELAGPQRWQPKLWRLLRERLGPMHRAYLQGRLFDQLNSQQGRAAVRDMPARLSVFGISAFAPSVLATLEQLAKFTEVHLFMLAPCQEYWFDIATDKERLRRGEEYLEVGHSLLAATGKQGKECMDMLLELEPDFGIDAYQSNGNKTLLQNLQHDILHLQQSNASKPLQKRQLDLDDQSIQIHNCHSALREVEVLHDQLLALFNNDPTLEPADVCVLSPVLDDYAPFIDAVFGAFDKDEARYIPHSLADQPLRQQEELRSALVNGLALAQGRLAVDAVLNLLQQAPVNQRFELDSNELDTISNWLESVNVHWGLDAEHRAAEGLPATDFASWQLGLRRLWLGLNFGQVEEGARILSDQLFNSTLPWPELEGSSVLTLAKLQRFIDTLASWQQQLSAKPQRSVAAWCDWLKSASTELLALPQEQEFELATLAESLTTLKQQGLTCEQDLPLSVVLDAWQAQQQTKEGGSRFLGGAVTFGSMVPMRSIPFRVLCLIGLNSAAYPRSLPAAEFDLMAADYRRGDRSRRHDDRYLFLEALLSARERFYLSFNGQQQRDDKPLPPSVLIDELLDSIERSWQCNAGSIAEQLITKHPLQPFSDRYFANHDAQSSAHDSGKNRLFSYAKEFVEAQQLRQHSGLQNEWAGSFVNSKSLADADSISIAELVAFARSPASYLLANRLGLRIEPLEAPLDARETFALDGLQNWQLNQQLLLVQGEEQGKDEDPASRQAAFAAAGWLPDAPATQIAYEAGLTATQPLLEPFQQWQQQAQIEPVSIELTIGDTRLEGVLPFNHGGGISGLTANGLSHFTVSKDKPSNEVGYWIQHLLLCAAKPAGTECTSYAYNLDGCYQFERLDADVAKEHLSYWLQAWRQAQKQALILEPDCSRQFAKKAAGDAKKGIEIFDTDRQPANNTFADLLGKFSDCHQWYRGLDGLDDDSVSWIMGLYAPLIAARTAINV